MQVGLVNLDDSAYLKLYQHIDTLNQNVILIPDVASFVETSCHILELENFRLMLHDLIKVTLNFFHARSVLYFKKHII